MATVVTCEIMKEARSRQARANADLIRLDHMIARVVSNSTRRRLHAGQRQGEGNMAGRLINTPTVPAYSIPLPIIIIIIITITMIMIK